MQTSDTQSDKLLSRAEVETHFGITRRYLETSAVRGDGPPMIRLGRSVRYRVADLRAWIDDRRVCSTSETLKHAQPETSKEAAL